MRGHGNDASEFLEYLWALGYTCSYCRDSFGLPADQLPSPEAPWNWTSFTASFGVLAEIPGHGAWGDLLCM
jgi:hypothetical protein